MKRKAMKPVPPSPIPAVALAARYDGGALKIEIVFQPEAAERLADEIANAVIESRKG